MNTGSVARKQAIADDSPTRIYVSGDAELSCKNHLLFSLEQTDSKQRELISNILFHCLSNDPCNGYFFLCGKVF